jgi:hypothetical protein
LPSPRVILSFFLLLDLTGLGSTARNLSSRRHRSRDHGEYWALSPRRGDNPSGLCYLFVFFHLFLTQDNGVAHTDDFCFQSTWGL